MYPNRPFAETRWVVLDDWAWDALARVTGPRGRSALIQEAVWRYLHDEHPDVLEALAREAAPPPPPQRASAPKYGRIKATGRFRSELASRAAAILAQREAAEAATGTEA